MEVKLQELRARLQKHLGPPRQVSPEFNAVAKADDTPVAMEPGAAEVEDDATFLELFAGEAGLTLAVKRCGLRTLEPGEVRAEGRIQKSMDISCTATFKKLKKLIKQKKVRWVHFAPPCRTFSRARRKDRYAKIRVLRSVSKPAGLEPKTRLVTEANLLASRSAQLALLQWKASGVFSIENPENSLIWLYQPIKKLMSLENVAFIRGDQCCFAGEYVKPTGWLTNGSFLEVLCRRCPGDAGGHHHKPLVGFATDFHEQQVFLTSLAAEYPQGLCISLAKAYAKFVKDNPRRTRGWQLVLTDDRDPSHLFSSKADRERENDECIGGMRNPSNSMLKLPRWREVGAMVWKILDKHLNRDAVFKDLHLQVGKDFQLEMQEPMSNLTATLMKVFKCEFTSNGLWCDLLVRLVRAADDPDTAAASWPGMGTPLGIEEAIPVGGVFPLVSEAESILEGQRLQSLGTLQGADDNYKSYKEGKEVADKLFMKEVDKGFAEWAANKADLEQKYGKLVPSAIGLITKTKLDGSLKHRLVHDLRRSRVNEHIRLNERLVLPRLKDVIEDVMMLMEAQTPGDEIEFMSLDFADAFKQLPVLHSEKKYLSGQAAGGHVVYHRVLFGIKTGPLVWGRIAALVARSTQSLFSPDRARLQVFVDDPLVTLRGSESQRTDIKNKILMWWLAMGLQVSWNKGATGTHAEWIGASLTIHNEANTLIIRVTADKIREWSEIAEELDNKPILPRKLLQRFTGKMSWAAGFVPQLKPFVRMLYAALSVKSPVPGKEGAVYHKQISPALRWIKPLLNDFNGGLERRVVAFARHQCQLDFYVDASPWGGGAVKLLDGVPSETFALQWTADDELRVGAKIGDPGSQALWEAYMALRCLWQWMTPHRQGFVRICGDAQGVLAAFIKRSSNMEGSIQPAGLPMSASGLRLRPGDGPPPRAPTSSQQLIDQGVIYTGLECDGCSLEIEQDDIKSCPDCDAGPFHAYCLRVHRCPGPSRLGMSGVAPLASFGRNSGEDDEARRVQEQLDEALSKAPPGQRVKREPDSGDAMDSPPKVPRFANLQEASTLFSSRAKHLDVIHLGETGKQTPFTPARAAAASPGTPAPGTPGKFRPSEPAVKPYQVGSEGKVKIVEEDEVAFNQAMAEFNMDKHASSNQSTHASRAKWWATRAETRGLKPYPLEPHHIDVAGALLKAGAYRSSAQYFAAMKREHITQGYSWSDNLTLAVKDAIRSCTRGQGPDKQSPPIDLRKLINVPDVPALEQGPARPRSVVVLFAFFACREAEAGVRLVKHIKDLLKTAEDQGHGPDDPLLVCPDGKPPNKAAMVKAFRQVALAAGYDEEYTKQITGHALRPSGAQHMARLGVEFYKIQLFCRWGSDTILRYLREVPMEDSDQWMNEATEKSLEEITEQLTVHVPVAKGLSRESVQEVVQEILSARSSEVLSEATGAQSEIMAILKTMTEQSVQMTEQWAAEFSRCFLPKYLVNRGSNKIHAIKDSYTTGCGFEFRLSRDCEFKTTLPEGSLCETAGCQKLFEAWK
eukprot:Skav215770  [mRNA]  locus=scaffold106:569116:574315:+ [translate_table: standard]